ncbi:hypothetical protein KF913_12190 [Candidatus Obscuribacterales bacterium]|nr:hypothetical protein [Candidatus Obscuribacterales bacterium]
MDDTVDRQVLLAAYFKNFENTYSEDLSSFWAHELMHELIDKDKDKAWEVILDLIDFAPNKESLAYVGADVLEEFLNCRGTRFIDSIEHEANSSKRFLYALANSWINKEAESYKVHQSIMKRFEILDECAADSIAAEIFSEEKDREPE